MTTKVNADNQAICEDWLGWLRQHNRAPITVYQYGAKCEELLTFLGATPLDQATLTQLEAWVARPRVGRGGGKLGADSTRAKDVDVLRGLWKYGCAHGRLMLNPTLDLERPRVRNEAPKAVDVATWDQFWSWLADDVARVVYGLQLYCGLRRHEVCFLEPRHVQLEAGQLADFKRKGDKNSKTSTPPIPVVSCARKFAQHFPRLLRAPGDFLGPLSALYEARRGEQWLIPWGEESLADVHRYRRSERPGPPDGMTSPDQINGRLLYFLKEAGMDERAFSPHALRHGFVTYLLRADVPLHVVSRLANHTSLNITQRYVKMADDPLAELIDAAPIKGSRW